MDKLATEGVVFEQAYVTAAVCGPSRAGILTGRYQQRFGYEENNVPGYMDNNTCLSDDDMGLPLEQKTIGNYMKELGYATGYFGKWHMGNADCFHPTKRGFDVFHDFRGDARSYYDYNSENPNYRHEDWLEHGYGQYAESEKYLTHELADQTIEFIEKNQEQPFFAFLSFNAVHTPMEPEEELLKEFPQLSGNRQNLAAMALSMDIACGKVLVKLKELGLDDNTIVIYTNDNGGPSDTNSSDNSPLSGTKANHLEGGIRVPFIIKWAGVIKPNGVYKYPISTLDILPTCVNAAGRKSEGIVALDGVDLIPFLLARNKNRPHHTLYWKKENRAAIRDGDWKLLRFPDRPAELYDLSKDISEVNNQAAEQPEIVK
ncbi:MAG: sulfatase-like hydrolase/transferase, partial [Bacteroidales bacterium]|nr:sulfatase-like hydrolase/transferase [Bacteroidales bacterium]